MQIILQATHGVVSGEPEFFSRAFGDTAEEFLRILAMPHDFIFNRDWYEATGRPELDDYRAEAARLSPDRRHELKTLLSSCDPRHYGALSDLTDDPDVRRILQFYMPRPKEELTSIWQRQAAWPKVAADLGVPEDERVEDAGLDAEEEPFDAGFSANEREAA